MIKNEHSVFKKLIFYNLPISMLPFLLTLALFFGYTCSGIRDEEYQNLKDKMDSYIQNVELVKNNAMNKTEYIIKNSEIIEWLETKPPELMDQLLLLKKVENYVSVINADPRITITIYTDNPSVLKSRFTDRLDNLTNYDTVLTKLEKMDYLYFDESLHTDPETAQKYLILYRRLMSESRIVIAVKAYLPENDYIEIIDNKLTEKHDKSFVSASITPKVTAVTEMDMSKLSAQYLRYGTIFLLIALMFCAVILFASRAVNNKTTNSISSFILSLSKEDVLKPGKLISINTGDNLELRIIKKALNELISKVNESKDAQYKAELNKKRLELDLLQSKINPHILYNSLASVSHRAFKKQDRELFEMIRNLTSYYRLVLAKGKEFTLLSEELDMIRKFISVNEISHSQKYNYTENIDAKLLDKKFLHLALQPFVENAIVHGLAGKKQECEISLKAFPDVDNMVIKIRDNGYGIKEDKLKELRSLSAIEGSYGIRNTYDRLSLYYNNKCKIEFDSEFGKYTEVTLIIPQNPNSSY